MSNWKLAQLNVAHLQAPINSELLADFVANIDRINILAESSAGFVWRLRDTEDPMQPAHGFAPDFIITLSVWESIEHLHDFVYRSVHKDIMRRRNEWFHRMPRSHMVLWWIPEDSRPTVAQGEKKLKHLQVNGPTQDAFTFRQAFVHP